MSAALRDASEPAQKPSASGLVPQHDVDAESAVLAAALADAGARAVVRPLVGTGEAFFSLPFRRVWQAMIELDDEGEVIDEVTVASRLKAQDRLAEAGGLATLISLLYAVPHVAHVESYARVVVDLYAQRQLVARCQRVAAEGYAPQENPAAWVAERTAYLGEVATARPGEGASPIGLLARETYDEIDAPHLKSVVKTGLGDFDAKTGGLVRGTGVYVCGRPGMGKSSLVLSWALHVADSGQRVLFSSREMPKKQITQRAQSILSGVPVVDWQKRAVRKQDVTEATQLLQSYPLFIHDKLHTPGEVRAEARRIQAGGGLDLVVVDYLQKYRPDRGSRAQSPEQEIAEMSGAFTTMASDLDVPVVIVAQLNRDVEERSPPVPVPSDIRGSGATENDAYLIVFPYRELFYQQPKLPDTSGPCDLIIAKHRNGPEGIVRAYFHAQLTSFRGLEPHERGPDD
jgi:replicative DNA helicase